MSELTRTRIKATRAEPSHGQTCPRPGENTVNEAQRRGPVTENSRYAALARRILRAYSRRIATGDAESLAHLIGLADDTKQAVNGPRTAGY